MERTAKDGTVWGVGTTKSRKQFCIYKRKPGGRSEWAGGYYENEADAQKVVDARAEGRKPPQIKPRKQQREMY